MAGELETWGLGDINEKESTPMTGNEQHPSTGMTMMLTLGAKSINAMTFRSFVDPQEARPDLAFYGDEKGEGRERQKRIDMDAPEFKMKSQRQAAAEKQALKEEEDESAPKKVEAKKFGTWDGVAVSCLLNIFGVIMFMRIGWCVGQAGIINTILIITISTVVTVLTTFSMAAICTNGTVKAGGAYYLISRAIGPNIGGAIGVLFSLGMSVATAMYVIGFCEAIVDNLKSIPGYMLTGSDINDVRVIGIALLIVLFIMVLIGVGWVIKLQLILLVVLLAAIASFVIGTFVTTSPELGVIGYSSDLLRENLWPAYTDNIDFMTVFSVFFPAVTGIMAGANISGDLRDPSVAIPRGTLWAVFISYWTYCALAIMIGAVSQRVVASSDTAGLLGDNLMMVKVAAWGPLVLIGIYAATFSSALASLVGAPRVLQSLADDGIIPFLKPFTVTRASDDAPVRGYVLALLLAMACVLIGELNAIAPLITMFFMMTYGLINLACFALSISKSPGWRPTFKYYTWWAALLGFVFCLVIMILTSVVYSIISLSIAFFIYKYVEWKAVKVNWGSAMEARKDMKAVTILQGMRTNQDHIKNFRPHYLVLSGPPKERLPLVRFVSLLRMGFGSTTFCNIIKADFADLQTAFAVKHTREEEQRIKKEGNNEGENLFKIEIDTGDLEDKKQQEEKQKEEKEKEEEENKSAEMVPEKELQQFNISTRENFFFDPELKIDAFLDTLTASSFRAGAQAMMQVSGLGRLRPNTIIMGFKEDWAQCASEDQKEYVNVIRDAFMLEYGVIITRGLEKLELTKPGDKAEKGNLDVWWLADDGGLTILINHILMLDERFSATIKAVRLIIVVESNRELSDLHILLTRMLVQFRLHNKWAIEVVPAGKSPPAEATISDYTELATNEIHHQRRPIVTRRWLRVAELMHEHSKDAKFVCALMPYPRLSEDEKDHLALLDMMSRDMPPMMMMRGNGLNVLTFASE